MWKCVLMREKPVKGILGTDIPPNKNHEVKDVKSVATKNYDFLVIPGGVKSLEKVRQNKDIINFITQFHKENKIIACIYVAVPNY